MSEYFQQNVKGKKYQEKGFVDLINDVINEISSKEKSYKQIEKDLEELKKLQNKGGENANISRNTKQD